MGRHTAVDTRDFRNVTRLKVDQRSMQVSILLYSAFVSRILSYCDLEYASMKYSDTTNDVPLPTALVPIHAFSRPHSHIPSTPYRTSYCTVSTFWPHGGSHIKNTEDQ